MAENYNHRHRVVQLPSLKKGEEVWIRDQQKYGTVTEKTSSPRAYRLETESGSQITRNRQALIHTGSNTEVIQEPAQCEKPAIAQPVGVTTRARAGLTIKAPKRLDL